MRVIVLIVLAAGALYGGQSAVLNGVNTGTFTIPNSGAFTTATSTYIAGRVDNLTVPSAGLNAIAQLGGLGLFVNGATGGACSEAALVLEDHVDTFNVDNFFVCAPLPAGATDVFFKFQRDAVKKQMTGEVWNYDGTGYSASIAPIDVLRSFTFPAGGSIGDASSKLHLAFLKWGAGTQPIGTELALYRPAQEQDSANLANWTFEGTGADSSGNGLTITFSNSLYASTPVRAPGCVLPQVSFSTAFPVQLDGTVCYPLDGGTALTYQWSYLGTGSDGVTQTPVFSSASAAQPVVTGLSRGSFNVQLIVRDGSGNATTETVHDGVVVTDSNHVVSSMGNASIDKLYMPMIQWGYNPWPWFDDRDKYYADFFGGLQASTFAPVWNTAQAGTIACSNGATTCTFLGANAQAIFCSGGNSSDGSWLVVWYNSGANRGVYAISACPSAATVTIGSAFRDASVAGAQYSRMSNTDIGNWINGSTNANYYDNVASHCALYYRSGIDTYYNYCHTLGRSWWTMPWIDQGRSCDLGGVYPCLNPRVRAMLGLVTLALDGTLSNFWSGMEVNWEGTDQFRITTALNPPLDDLRERSASMAMVAYAGLFEPNASSRSAALTALSSSIANFWSRQQQADGSYVSLSFGPASWNGYPGTVSVTNGSTTVVGSGTAWSSGEFPAGNYFYTQAALNPTCTPAQGGDSTAYLSTFVDATHITISPAYQGATASGRFWQNSNLVGCGTQPFMMGYNARALYHTYQALLATDPTNAGRAKTLLLNDVNWLVTKGFFANSAAPAPVVTNANGLFYGRNFPGCEPNPFTDQQCSQFPFSPASTFDTNSGVQGTRFLAAETMPAYSYAYLLGGSAAVKANADTLYGAMYGGFGGPNADSNYLWMEYGSVGALGIAQIGVKAKDFGFAWGWGNGALWPALRLGAPAQSAAGGNSASGVVSAGASY